MYAIFRLVLIFALMIFVPYKLAQWYGVHRKYIVVLIFMLITIGCIVTMVLSSRYGGNALGFLYKVSMYWIGFLLFVTTLTILYAIIGKLLPISSKHAVVAIGCTSVIIAIYSSFQATNYKNYEIELEIAGLSEPVTIYHAPDVHLGAFAGAEHSQRIVNDINSIKPDLVLFNGDFFDSKLALTRENLAPFKESTVPMYFTIGNHDLYVGMDEISALFNEYGIVILENDIIDVKGLQILGLDYLNADEHTVDSHSSKKAETIKSTLPTLNIEKDKPLVIAHHKPIGIPYMAEAGANLILSGHTHAGQIFPATLIAALQFEYLKGLYPYNDSMVYVTKGLGTFGPPMRLGAEAEATIIKLIPKK